ncbi:hypothetical protein AVEN_62364-1 [Araneus ventricosus]|uniref:Uncharacterized protein n=1 Tax=Araneus ventricosus TaxID=182803 RepID=A0A4Y2H2I5_ARAVE|nr:hypothetical protein AVEN_62364-1 [Araneus ventricosus]
MCFKASTGHHSEYANEKPLDRKDQGAGTLFFPAENVAVFEKWSASSYSVNMQWANISKPVLSKLYPEVLG